MKWRVNGRFIPLGFDVQVTETSSTSEIFTEPSECVEVNIVMISHVVEYRQHFRIFDNTFIGGKILKKYYFEYKFNIEWF